MEGGKDVVRLGKHEEGDEQPLKGNFKSQATKNDIISRTWTPADKEEFKDIWIKRDVDEEEETKYRN